MPPSRLLRRLYWIDASLQHENCLTASRLGRELGISRTTSLRDLGRLRDEFRAPVIYDPSLGGFRYGHPFTPDLPDLSLDEALEMSRLLTRNVDLAGSALERTARRKIDALRSLFPGEPGPAAAPRGSRRSNEPPRAEQAQRDAAPPAARQLGESVQSGRPCLEEPVVVRIRFDAEVGTELIKGRHLRREEAQLLTDGGLEANLVTRDPDALLLDLMRWAPHFAIASPAWVRRRFPTLLRGMLRHWEGGGTGRAPARAAKDRGSAPGPKPRHGSKPPQTKRG
ncbi:MAG: WYL domain-containing protein [Candidatus Eisenbacteria bacterium]